MYEKIRMLLPAEFSKQNIDWQGIEELRLRCNQPAMLLCGGGERKLQYVPDRAEIHRMVLALTEHSLHAYQEQLRQGFFTVDGGVRIGVGGRAVQKNGEVIRLDDFTSLNIRFPHALPGLAREIMPYLLSRGKLQSTLILSPPQQGKTTLLCDIIRCVSTGDGCIGQKCVVIDGREELWSEQFDLGMRTDVLRCEKQVGMAMALRTLSPQVIATDELGDVAEWNALMETATAGVTLLATAHGDCLQKLRSRPLFEKMWQYHMIDRFVILSDSLGRGTVEQILDGQGQVLLHRPLLLNRKVKNHAV